MTARLTLNSPLLLGFENIERTLDRLAKSAGDGYPPYNIEQIGKNGLRITLAVAGFAEGDLSVQVEVNQLTVRGRQNDDEKTRLFLHRGIAARQFQKSFLLADGIEIRRASLDNGLLHIDMSRPVPQSQMRHIEISKIPHGGEHGTEISVETDRDTATTVKRSSL